MIRMSIDLETLGTSLDSAILSIGIAVVQDDAGLIASTVIYPSVSEQHQSLVSYDTIQWWMFQEEGARAETFVSAAQRIPLLQTFKIIRDVWKFNKVQEVWGNGPLMDIALIEGMAQKYGHTDLIPWNFREVRCLRTLKMLAPDVERIKSTIPHSARHDAIAQGLWAAEMIKWLKK